MAKVVVMTELARRTKEFVLQEGAHLAGIAPVERFEGAPKGTHPCDLLPDAQSVIVYAIRFYRSVLECSNFQPELIAEADLWDAHRDFFYNFMYNTVNLKLQMVAVQTAHFLSENGHKTLPLSLWSFFSFRHAAVLAGIGEIGLNNLLVTPEYGPRVRIHCVLTTAKLTPDPMLTDPLCPGESCGLCLEAKNCYGEIEEWNLAGKTMQVAKMPDYRQRCETDKGSGLCRKLNPDNKLPYIRYCWGVCPVGENQD